MGRFGANSTVYSVFLLMAAIFLSTVFRASEVQATPTGLNNIPTADTAPEKTLVLQTFGNWAQDSRRKSSFDYRFGKVGHLVLASPIWEITSVMVKKITT